MGKNYMPEVAKMLGVEIGEEFDILNKEGKKIAYGPYKITNNAIVDCDREDIPNLFYGLLKGEYTLQKRPRRTKYGDNHWVVFDNRGVHCSNFYGNCFPTKEAAEAAVPEMLAKFEEIKKGVRE